MASVKRFITIGSVAVLGLFAVFVVSTPFLREPPVPVVNVTIEPQPLPETTEPSSGPPDETTEPLPETTKETTRAYEAGLETGERLNHLWETTKDFGRGLWSTLSEKDH